MAPRLVVVGTGPRHVLALHGWFGSAAGRGPFAELLGGDRYPVAFVDYRGYGARRGESGSFSLAEIAADALAAVEDRGSRFAIIDVTTGNRLSSSMQQTFLEQYPNASLEVSSNAGHYAPFETPVALLTCAERFLDAI